MEFYSIFATHEHEIRARQIPLRSNLRNVAMQYFISNISSHAVRYFISSHAVRYRKDSYHLRNPSMTTVNARSFHLKMSRLFHRIKIASSRLPNTVISFAVCVNNDVHEATFTPAVKLSTKIFMYFIGISSHRNLRTEMATFCIATLENNY